MQEVYFPVLFPEYIPPEGLEEALAQLLVTAAEVDQAARSIRLTGTSGVYIAQRRLREVEDALRHRYGLRECAIAVRYPESLLPQMEFRDLAQVLIRAYSPAAAILAGAKWELDGDELHVHLAANGKAALAPHLPKGEAFLQELFGVRKTLVLHSATELEGKALFAETERIRQEAIKNAPAIAVAAAAVQKKKAASGPSDSSSSNADLIFGRPFGGEVVKISDLNLDMFRVVVQGKVFAVNHRELKKRGAWVVSFDVTDYPGSVRINQFMEADKAKPILDGVQAGMWVKIQGKMTFDRYDNEMVMQPNSILKVSAPKRVDTAPDKRVELHLHTTMSAMDALTKTVVHQFLLQVYDRSKTTVFFITHDLEEAIFLGSKVYIMTTRPATIKKILDVDIPRKRISLTMRTFSKSISASGASMIFNKSTICSPSFR